MTLGEKIQQLRREKGLSQDQLAEMLNVSRQAVSKWERDEAVPETDKVIRLSEIFSVSIDFLLKEQPQPAQEPPQPQRSDFFSRAGHLVRTKGYLLGYVLAAWGVLDFLRVLLVRIVWHTMTGVWSGVPDFGDVEIQGIMNAPLTAVWLIVIPGILKIAGGILVVIYGRRYSKKMEGKS